MTLYRYDGGTNFQELREAGQFNELSIVTELIRAGGLGGGIGSVLYSDRTMAPDDDAGPWEGFLYNAVGHTTVVTNSAGSPTQASVYEAFGQTVYQTGTSRNNRLANTKERDASISLDNHGFRYYDPEIGRYLTRDPIGYGDGLNVYAHVGNNPITGFDPLGLTNGKSMEDFRARRDAMRNRPPTLFESTIPTHAQMLGSSNIPEGYNEFHQGTVLPMVEPGAKAFEAGVSAITTAVDTFGLPPMTHGRARRPCTPASGQDWRESSAPSSSGAACS